MDSIQGDGGSANDGDGPQVPSLVGHVLQIVGLTQATHTTLSGDEYSG